MFLTKSDYVNIMQKQTAVLLLILVSIILSMSSLPVDGLSDSETSKSSIRWYSFESGIEKAERINKPIFINFMTDTCGTCQRMENETYTDESVQEKTDEVVFIKVNARERTDLVQRYEINVVPTLVFETPGGDEIDRETGFVSASDLVGKLDDVSSSTEDGQTSSDEGETPFWRSFIFLEVVLSISAAVVIILVLIRVKGNSDE